MSPPRCLFVISADFGEYVTASVFSRGQPIAARFAVPAALARYRSPEQTDVLQYSGLEELENIVARERPDMVVLCSGYLFAINRLIPPDALAALIARLRAEGIALATTDPWLRIWSLKPEARFAIHSIRKGGIDAQRSDAIAELQRYLEQVFRDVPHLLAVPLNGANERCHSVFNREFTAGTTELAAGTREAGRDRWLFVLSNEDLALAAGPNRLAFFRALEARIDELTALEKNHLIFIGPERLAQFFGERMAGRQRVTFIPFCDFAAFEAAVRQAKIVVYWNVLSASLLYCLYHRVAPVFLGKGHQAKVCEGLFEHVVENVYQGRPPALLDLNAPMMPDADALIARWGLMRWLDDLRRDYARLPAPAPTMERLIRQHA